MTVAEYIVQTLVNFNVTDVFGVPGGVVFDFLYAIDENSKIIAHLSSNEQAAGYAAIGYAQAFGRLGVAYATRGPGITNMITPIADAFFDSVPVLFLTAHNKKFITTKQRFTDEQEFDTIATVKKITKYAARIEKVSDVRPILIKLLSAALTGRQGSVLLDIQEKLLKMTIDELPIKESDLLKKSNSDIKSFIVSFERNISSCSKPVFLIGNGVRQSKTAYYIRNLASKMQVPIISSGIALDLVKGSEFFFGFIGSHGSRIANYILYHADVIFVFGNRMAYDKKSETFSSISKKKIVRIEIDKEELSNNNSREDFCYDLSNIFNNLEKQLKVQIKFPKWFDFCEKVKKILIKESVPKPEKELFSIFNYVDENFSLVTDIGNNEFWVADAYSRSSLTNRLIMSKSFAALGSALSKAIGVYYATSKPVIAFVGDHAMIYSFQELLFIKNNNLPIIVFIINNYSSGMIKSKQKLQNRKKYIHSTLDSGYHVPDFYKIAKASGLKYYEFNSLSLQKHITKEKISPCVIELKISSNETLPRLPKGNLPFEFVPELRESLKEKLRRLENETSVSRS